MERSAPCLYCAYDLRSAVHENPGLLVCPECGEHNELHEVLHQGVQPRFVRIFTAAMLAPAVALLVPSYVIEQWSSTPIHFWISMLFTTIVLPLHMYAISRYVDATLTARASPRRRWILLGIISAFLVDAAALVIDSQL